MARSIRIPSYRLHKPTNQAIVVIRGRTFYLGRYGSNESRDEYMQDHCPVACCKSPATGPGAAPVLATEPDLSVSELTLAYWRHVEAYYVKDGRPTSRSTSCGWPLKPVR